MKLRIVLVFGIFALCAVAFFMKEEQTPFFPEPSVSSLVISDETEAKPEPSPVTTMAPAEVLISSNEVRPREVGESRTHKLVLGTGEPVEWKSDTPAAYQAQVVELDTSLFTGDKVIQEGDTLEFELFGQPYAAAVSKVNRWSNGTVAVTTTFGDDPHSRAYLSYTGEVARLLVEDRATGETYQIRYDPASESHIALEVDMAGSDIRACGVDSIPVESLQRPVAHANEVLPAPAESSPPTASAAPSSAVTFDLLVVYSQAAFSYESNNLANMQNNISISVSKANTVLSNSQIDATINLVHTEMVTYTEQDPNTDLNRLTATADGFVDNVHTLRDTHNADFVSFFISTSAGGLGWGGEDYHSPEYAFHVARVQQTDFTSTMMHEMGHNMGLGHSATQVFDPGPGDIYPYGAGWQWADASSSASVGYCTIMTYINFDNDGTNGDEYIEIDYFSNPNLTYNGNSIGNASSGDSARVIQQGRFELASYRGAAVTITEKISTFPYSNSFESNLDYFYQDGSDDHFWFGTQTGNTVQNPTGPTSGAQNGDYYAYVIGIDPVSETTYYNQTANLLANVDFTGKTNGALQFYYHMYDGDNGYMGSLHVDVSTDSGSTWITDVWSISGNQGDTWHLQQVDLSAYSDMSIVLRFRVVVGSSFLTDTCIDNVTITADDLPTFSSWMSTNYPGISDATSGGDPDSDGVSNFLEYALGMTPTTSDAQGLPTLVYSSGGDVLGITFTRDQAGVRYVVESSSSPDFASPTTVWDSNTNPAGLVAVGASQTVSVAMSGASKLFLRVRVSE